MTTSMGLTLQERVTHKFFRKRNGLVNLEKHVLVDKEPDKPLKQHAVKVTITAKVVTLLVPKFYFEVDKLALVLNCFNSNRKKLADINRKQ